MQTEQTERTHHEQRKKLQQRVQGKSGVLEALREESTVQELATKYSVHPNQISL